MRLPTFVLVLLVAVAVSVVLYMASGGQLLFFGLPLLFAAPLLARRRRR